MKESQKRKEKKYEENIAKDLERNLNPRDPVVQALAKNTLINEELLVKQ